MTESPLVYTRKRDRLLALLWAPKRRKLEMMRLLAKEPIREALRTAADIQTQLALYGTAYVKISPASSPSSLVKDKDAP